MTSTPNDVTQACDYCGSEAQVSTIHAAGLIWSQVECLNDKCCATGPCRDTEAEAITAWNTRAPSPAGDDVGRLREALDMFARLEIPAKPTGNAGFYSIPFERIAKAKAARAGLDSAGRNATGFRRIVETLASSDCECDPAYSTRTCLRCQALAALSDTVKP